MIGVVPFSNGDVSQSAHARFLFCPGCARDGHVHFGYNRGMRSLFALLVAACSSMATPPVSAFVISEIHYNPPAGSEGLEFIEITNDAATPQDLSGYAFVEGISFLFPPGTILEGFGILVVCANVEAVRAAYGDIPAIGNFSGRLDGSGERLTIANHSGVVLQSLSFRDEGKWPVGPDGTGHTLVLANIYDDPKEPESWRQSPELGGSPGLPNFPEPDAPDFLETVLVEEGALWSFMTGTQPFSDPPTAWRAVDFDDSAWPVGPSGFGIGDGDDNTVLEGMRNSFTSVAIRHRIRLTEGETQAPNEHFLAINFDDGFCAFLNGVELVAANCPDAIVYDAIATATHEARGERIFRIDRELLRVGENVLAIVGYNDSLSGRDFSLIPRVLRRQFLDDTERAEFRGRFNELYRGGDRESGWLEIYNGDDVAIDLSGARITDDPDRPSAFAIPSHTTVRPGGFYVVDEAELPFALSDGEVRLFLLDAKGVVLTASVFDKDPSPELALADFSEARFPDGDPQVWITTTPTQGTENRVSLVSDIVINELYYHPPEDRPGEFLELFHRGSEPRDLSGFRFTKGISYVFPPGTVLAPGDYLVLAQDPSLLHRHYELENVHGPYEGVLANGGENLRLVDRLGNLVDEVRYWDGGRWPLWADGRGASLELIDPHADNDFATAWGASDELEKTSWERLSFVAPAFVPAQDSVFYMLLPERGVCRVDDLAVVNIDAQRNHIPGSDFESQGSADRWRIQGTHELSRRITTDSHSGVACLEVVATGRGDSMCNRLELSTEPRMPPGAYEVSLWTRWQRGTSLLVVHGDFTAGPWFGTRDVNLSNNSLGARLRMTVPWNLGTPGLANSRRVELIAATGSDNLGPVIAGVRHAPFSPLTGAPTRVEARVADVNGIATVHVFFKRDTADLFESRSLFDDGAHDDGRAGDGVYAGQIPAFNEKDRVVFYIEAVDELGSSGRFPAEAPDKTCVYMVQEPFRESLQIVLDTQNETWLAMRPLFSNALVDATVNFEGDNVYYNVGLRYRGSPWGRPQMDGYRLRFAKDKPFHRGLTQTNLTNHDRGDIRGYFLIGRNASASKAIPVSDYRYQSTRLNDLTLGNPGLFDPIGRGYLEKWYGDEAVEDIVCLKATGRHRGRSCNLAGWDETTLLHMDDSSENYRFYWFHSVHQTRDNWRPLMRLTEVMDPAHTADADFAREVHEVLDVEAFLRVLGTRILMVDWDALFIGNGHNGYMVRDPLDGRWELLPFDFGAGFSSTDPDLVDVRDTRVARLFTNPETLRMHYRLIDSFLDGYWSPALAGPFFEELGGGTLDFLAKSSERVQAKLEPVTQVPFRITSNDGEDFLSEVGVVELEGEASVKVASLMFSVNENEAMELPVSWRDGERPVSWRVSLSLRETENQVRVFAIDGEANVVDSDAIGIAWDGSPALFLRGDVRGDGALNMADPVAILFHLFRGRPLDCGDAADIDDDGVIDIDDALALLLYLYVTGPPPARPFPEVGEDTSVDSLGCATAGV